MKLSFVLLLLAGLCLAGGADAALAAQNAGAPIEDLPLPPGYPVQRAPNFAKWSATYLYPDTAKPKAAPNDKVVVPQLALLTVTKTNTIYHEEKLFTNGSRHDSWHVGNMQIVLDPATQKPSIYDPSSFGHGLHETDYNPELYTDYSASDFPELAWVSAQNYLGVQKTRGADYLLFRRGPAGAPATVEAWIDADTGLPFQLRAARATVTYAFVASPVSVQALPPDIQKLLERRAAVIRKLTTRVPSF